MSRRLPPFRCATTSLVVSDGAFLFHGIAPTPCHAQTSAAKLASYKLKATTIDGWKPQQIADEWVIVTIIPEVGGRVTQVPFAVQISGSLGVFSSGEFIAQVYDAAGLRTATVPIQDVSPTDLIRMQKVIAIRNGSAWLSRHLIDQRRKDRGSLGEAHFAREDGSA